MKAKLKAELISIYPQQIVTCERMEVKVGTSDWSPEGLSEWVLRKQISEVWEKSTMPGPGGGGVLPQESASSKPIRQDNLEQEGNRKMWVRARGYETSLPVENFKNCGFVFFPLPLGSM